MNNQPARVTLIADLSEAASKTLLAVFERKYGTALFGFSLIEWIGEKRSTYELTCNEANLTLQNEFAAFADGYVQAMRNLFVYEQEYNAHRNYGVIFATTEPAARKIVEANAGLGGASFTGVSMDPARFADDGRVEVHEFIPEETW